MRSHPTRSRARWLIPVVLAAWIATPSPSAAQTTRTVFVAVTDGQGAPVPDLGPADFAIKEGGKDREVASAALTPVKMRVALMLDERMTHDGPTRTGLFEFIKRVQPSAEIAFILVGLRNITVVEYTSDINALVGALNNLSLNPGKISNFTEGILQVAKDFEASKPERPVMVGLLVAAGSGSDEVGGGSISETLNHLRQSGASMNVVVLGGAQGGTEQVLGDGSRHSGGRRLELQSTTGVPKALQQIADDLTSQYRVQYTLPAGVKADKRLSVSVKRKGLTVRFPDAIPDK